MVLARVVAMVLSSASVAWSGHPLPVVDPNRIQAIDMIRSVASWKLSRSLS
jgi:hypothetical protein